MRALAGYLIVVLVVVQEFRRRGALDRSGSVHWTRSIVMPRSTRGTTMRKVLTVVGATAVAALLSLSIVASASAHPIGPVGAGIVGGVLGFMAGAAIANSAPAPYYPYYDGAYDWHMHVRECFRAYGDDYDPRSDTYIDYDGYERRCRL